MVGEKHPVRQPLPALVDSHTILEAGILVLEPGTGPERTSGHVSTGTPEGTEADFPGGSPHRPPPPAGVTGWNPSRPECSQRCSARFSSVSGCEEEDLVVPPCPSPPARPLLYGRGLFRSHRARPIHHADHPTSVAGGVRRGRRGFSSPGHFIRTDRPRGLRLNQFTQANHRSSPVPRPHPSSPIRGASHCAPRQLPSW